MIKSKNSPVTKQEEERIKCLYAEGMPIVHIADMVKRSPSACRNVLFDLKSRKPKKTPPGYFDVDAREVWL